MENFKFDFRKSEDVAKYDALSQKQKAEIKEADQNNVTEMTHRIETGESMEYQEAFELIENEKREFKAKLRSTVFDFLKGITSFNKNFYKESPRQDDFDKMDARLESVWTENPDEQINSKERNNLGLGHYWERIEEIEEIIEKNPDTLNYLSIKTGDIPTEQIESQLKLRYKILSILNEIGQKSMNCDVALIGESNGFLDIRYAHECGIQLGALMLAPNSNTTDFFELLNSKKLLEPLFKEIEGLKSYQQRSDNFEKIFAFSEKNYLNHIKNFSKKNINWKDKRVLEFGGSETASRLSENGAIKEIVDAGNSGYKSFGYDVNDKSKIITLSNYLEKPKKATADLICSANTLDWESGIENMAVVPSWTENSVTLKCVMAMDELALIFYGQLKDGAFMIHDELGLPDDLCELIGIEKVADFTFSKSLDDNPQKFANTSWSDEYLHFYKKTGKPKIQHMIIGRKIAIYDEELDAWKYAGMRTDRGDILRAEKTSIVLNVDEFILCAKRDLKYSDRKDNRSFDFRTGKRLSGGILYLARDGFTVDCKSGDIKRMLVIVKPHELAETLSENSKNDPNVWQELLNKCKTEDEKKRIVQYVPENLKPGLNF